MQINRRLYLSISLWEFRFAATCLKKNRSEKFLFLTASDWIVVIAGRWSVKYVFALNSTIFRKISSREAEKWDGERQLQNVILSKQMQKLSASLEEPWLVHIRDSYDKY